MKLISQSCHSCILIFFLWCFSLTTLNSQVTYFNYLDHSVQYQWYSSGSNFANFFTVTANYYVSKDTLINGNWFYRQDVVINHTNSPSYSPGTVFIREDTANKFYQYYPSNGQEYMVYDWKRYDTLQIGDSIPGFFCKVTAIDSVQFGSGYRRRWHGPTSSTTKRCVIEGIGATGEFCMLSLNAATYMTCYKKQTSSLTLEANYTNCKYVNSNPITGLPEAAPFQKQHAIYPNPARSEITVSVTGKASLTLFNSVGGIVFRREIENDQQVSVSSFPKGLYFYDLESADGSRQKGRLLVE